MTIKVSKTDTSFVDISLSFVPNPISGDLTVLRDDRAIINAVKNLVLIKPNEVPFQRNIGSTVSELLFEFCDKVTADQIRKEIIRTINYNEPRVELTLVKVTPYPEQNNFAVYIEFKIIGYERVFTIEEILTPTR